MIDVPATIALLAAVPLYLVSLVELVRAFLQILDLPFASALKSFLDLPLASTLECFLVGLPYYIFCRSSMVIPDHELLKKFLLKRILSKSHS